jgi:hypothetical protein
VQRAGSFAVISHDASGNSMAAINRGRSRAALTTPTLSSYLFVPGSQNPETYSAAI